MSKYTMEVKEICESIAGDTSSSGYSDMANLIETARPKIFDFDFPIYDEDYRATLETNFIRHFFTREICAETFGRWKLFLQDKFNLIMPKYNGLYKEATYNINPFYDVDYSRKNDAQSQGTLTDKTTVTQDKTGKGTETGSTTEKIEGSSTNSTTRGTDTTVTTSGTDTATTNYGKTDTQTDKRNVTVEDTGTDSQSTNYGKKNTRTSSGSDTDTVTKTGTDTDNLHMGGTLNHATTDTGTVSNEGSTTKTGSEQDSYGSYTDKQTTDYGKTSTDTQAGSKTTTESGTEKRKYSDMPMGEVTNIDSGKYLTNYTVTEPGKITTEAVSDGFNTKNTTGGTDETSTTHGAHSDTKTYNSVKDATANTETRGLSGSDNLTRNADDNRTLTYDTTETATHAKASGSEDVTSGTDTATTNYGKTQTTKGNAGTLENASSGSDSQSTNYGKTETTANTGTDTNTGNTSEDKKGTSSLETSNNENTTGTSDKTQTTTTTDGYITHVMGKTAGSGSYAKMILDYRNTLINIDEMIMNDCEDLFMQLW